jgi:glucose uptake protein GlcU
MKGKKKQDQICGCSFGSLIFSFLEFFKKKHKIKELPISL